MNLMKFWLASTRKWRVPTTAEADAKRVKGLYRQVFGTPAGQELLTFWIDEIVMQNPATLDPYEAIQWETRHKFVQDLIRSLDMAEEPEKYKQPELAKPTNVLGGHFGGSRQ